MAIEKLMDNAKDITVSIPAELGEHLVGLWRFRQVAHRPTWCTTFTIDGRFYDTVGTLNPQAAVKRAVSELRKTKRLKAKEGKK